MFTNRCWTFCSEHSALRRSSSRENQWRGSTRGNSRTSSLKRAKDLLASCSTLKSSPHRSFAFLTCWKLMRCQMTLHRISQFKNANTYASSWGASLASQRPFTQKTQTWSAPSTYWSRCKSCSWGTLQRTWGKTCHASKISTSFTEGSRTSLISWSSYSPRNVPVSLSFVMRLLVRRPRAYIRSLMHL